MTLAVRSVFLHQQALDGAMIAVKKAKRDHVTLAVSAEALRLFNKYPNCSMSRVALEEEITRLGVSDQVAMQFG